MVSPFSKKLEITIILFPFKFLVILRFVDLSDKLRLKIKINLINDWIFEYTKNAKHASFVCPTAQPSGFSPYSKPVHGKLHYTSRNRLGSAI